MTFAFKPIIVASAIVLAVCIPMPGMLTLGCGGLAKQPAGGMASGATSGGESSGGFAGGGAGGALAGAGGAFAGGAGNAAVAGPECVTDADCKIFDDCCSCNAVSVAETPASCHSTCKQSACAALGLPTLTASCVVGQCVAGFNCNTHAVLCKSVPPECPGGQVPLLAGSCWEGGCVPAEQCASVSACAACTGPLDSMTCVQEISAGTSHCVSIQTGCDGQCACLGARVCVQPGDMCTDLSGQHGVACGL